MSFKVRLFLGAPDFETLHVAKLREYPLNRATISPMRRRASVLLQTDCMSSSFRSSRSRCRKAKCALFSRSPPARRR